MRIHALSDYYSRGTQLRRRRSSKAVIEWNLASLFRCYLLDCSLLLCFVMFHIAKFHGMKLSVVRVLKN